MNENRTWAPKGSSDRASLVTVSGFEGDDVLVSAEGGGFVSRRDRAEFERAFEPVDARRLAALDKGYERGAVRLEYFDEDASIPCWLNGREWNGWSTPWFERADLEKAIADGLIECGKWSDLRFDEDLATFVEIMPQGGNALPDGFDPTKAARQASSEGGYAEVAIGGDDLAGVGLASTAEIETPDGTITVYRVGDGWCWEPADAPEHATAPQP